jgi:hypothetical protein
MMVHGLDTDLDVNGTHDYFVGVVKNVRKALHPRFPSKEKGQRPESPKKEDVSRGFHALSIEEHSEEFLNAPDVERPQQAQGDSTDYEAEEEEDIKGSGLLVWALLLLEAQNIRSQINWI